MCVIFFYVDSNPGPNGLKLILASNRDEFYARETLDADRWANFPHVFGGIDQQTGREGGSWLAISGKDNVLKMGALLNVTGEPKARHTEGRGMIVSDFVSGDVSLEEYNQKLVADCEKYSAFNFVAIELRSTSTPSITLLSNAPKVIQTFGERECHGFGNSPSSSPLQKVIAGRDSFKEIVNKYLRTENGESQEDLVKRCFELLKNERKHWPDEELAKRAPNWGEHLSAINVKITESGYGSRTHTVILVDANNKMHFYEETMQEDDPDGKWNCKHIVEQFFRNENGSCGGGKALQFLD